MPGVLSVPVHRLTAGGDSADGELDLVAVEEPLQIRIGERDVAVAMRTPGEDAELAAGFSFTEGLLGAGDIANIRCRGNTATIELTPGVEVRGHLDDPVLQRNFYVSSSCGVCGRTSIDAIEASGDASLRACTPQISAEIIRTLPAKLRRSQRVFERTGGLHACGLFRACGDLLLVREDVGRHNAVDKVIGWALMNGSLPLRDHILLVSGRASFELVQKAIMAGVPMLAAVGAPSSLAVKTALRFGLTLIGFLRDDRFNIYSAPARVDSIVGPSPARSGHGIC